MPLIRSFYKRLNTTAVKSNDGFVGSRRYWERRYEKGRNSGDGSYNELAVFKAEVLNAFVKEQGVDRVIEYGCGDGNQLSLAEYPIYTGFDVSDRALELCEARFAGDTSKTFKRMDAYDGERADLTLSLDVVYHLVEDPVFEAYMARLFDSADDHVIIYASNSEKQLPDQAPHVRHRVFTDWVAAHRPQWVLTRQVPNRYPFDPATETGSFADFFFFERR
ncbi:class I SAM-dependent methyltransferase [Salinisphaera dokdonensis]|uniref:class I SAM-dependent methyltransferase n=1 Tax=Salinisphaera dokdonensis TaxID=454598 RepID=UPI00333EC6BA